MYFLAIHAYVEISPLFTFNFQTTPRVCSGSVLGTGTLGQG